MKVWTYGELADKVRLDLDQQDELQVTPDEIAGYCNEGIDQAEAEILTLAEDYFLKDTNELLLVSGQNEYALPSDCYAAKIRGLLYVNGSRVYPIKRFRNYQKFEQIVDAENFGQGADYVYWVKNSSPATGYRITLVPTPQESGALTRLFYIRNAQHIPLLGEWVEVEDVAFTAWDSTPDTLTVTQDVFATGDEVRFTEGDLPAPIAAGTSYFVIRLSATAIQLATTYANAVAGTAIDFAGFLAPQEIPVTLSMVATELYRRALPVDIPEFHGFVLQIMKVRTLQKDGTDPRLADELVILQNERKMMQDTLEDMVPDNDDTVSPDLSHYEEHT